MSAGVFVLVNEVVEVVPTQTTAMLIRAAAARGHDVAVAGVGDLLVEPGGGVRALARRLAPAALPDTEATVRALRASPRTWVDLEGRALALLRTNPARDDARARLHQTALAAMCRLRAAGVRVVNDPDGLMRAASKLYLDQLPAACRPVTLVTRDLERARAFFAQHGRCVLKPLHGTRGRDVFVVEGPDALNLPALFDVVVRDGYALLQTFVPGAEEGDVRVVVFDGEPLAVDGRVAAIRRVPAAGDARSNLHAGGTPERAVLGKALLAALAAIGPVLVRDGLRLVGLDFIGAQVIEANVHATGGLRDAERFEGVDFSGALLERLEL